MEIKICAWCGKEFEPSKRFRKYCCKECAREAKKLQMRRRQKKDSKVEYRKCKYCGKTFIVDQYHKSYCSKECREKYYDCHPKKQSSGPNWKKEYPDQWLQYLKDCPQDYSNINYIPFKCYVRGQTSCLTCTLSGEHCD